ncbi:tyrosine-type recombinase/integrase [Spartinivicinus ruber]|uniref:tyrosine-type recombinase/integrase n=1 Tax=Spartinivicinus ruber TaxID=2683272 RepID=UPI0013D49CCE|nr:site-specific integrase [Spartinivicinus ruber]
MARQKVFIQGEHFIGEFPHDAEIGFQASKRGLRRRLCKVDELRGMKNEERIKRLQALYVTKEKAIRHDQLKQEAQDKQQTLIRQKMTVKDAGKQWLAEILATNNPKTYRNYKRTIDLYLAACGNHVLRQFSRRHNITFFNYLQAMPSPNGGTLSAATQNYHMRQLNAFLMWAYEHEIINKRHQLKKAVQPQKDMETLDIELLERLGKHIESRLTHAQTTREHRHLANMLRAYKMATQSLLRIGAIWAMKLEWIDLDSKLIRIQDNLELDWKPKKLKWPNKPINQHLFSFLMADLATRPPQERYFLDNGKGQPWYADKSDISKFATKLCKECGLPAIKPFHWGMRATMITHLLLNGAEPHKVQQLADHSSLATTMLYFNTRKVDQAEVAELLPEV